MATLAVSACRARKTWIERQRLSERPGGTFRGRCLSSRGPGVRRQPSDAERGLAESGELAATSLFLAARADDGLRVAATRARGVAAAEHDDSRHGNASVESLRITGTGPSPLRRSSVVCRGDSEPVRLSFQSSQSNGAACTAEDCSCTLNVDSTITPACPECPGWPGIARSRSTRAVASPRPRARQRPRARRWESAGRSRRRPGT
jgi:hypothetical protein